jgi:hypothetical protein
MRKAPESIWTHGKNTVRDGDRRARHNIPEYRCVF